MRRIRLDKGYYITNSGTNSKGKTCALSYLWIGNDEGECIGTLEGSQIISLKSMIASVEGAALARKQAKLSGAKDEA